MEHFEERFKALRGNKALVDALIVEEEFHGVPWTELSPTLLQRVPGVGDVSLERLLLIRDELKGSIDEKTPDELGGLVDEVLFNRLVEAGWTPPQNAQKAQKA